MKACDNCVTGRVEPAAQPQHWLLFALWKICIPLGHSSSCTAGIAHHTFSSTNHNSYISVFSFLFTHHYCFPPCSSLSIPSCHKSSIPIPNMLTLLHFSCWITVNDQPLMEYDPKIDPYHHTITCWIPSTAGKVGGLWCLARAHSTSLN